MKLTIFAIGRMKAGPEKELCDDYLTRARATGRSCGITALDSPGFCRIAAMDEPPTGAKRKPRACGRVPSPAPTRSSSMKHGRALNSAGFRCTFAGRSKRDAGEIAFLIGGPDGHAQIDPRSRRRFSLSLGPMTWPHRLVRVMLAEQIYRAVTIMVNHPYHRP